MRRFGVHAGRSSRCRLSVVSIAVLAMLSPLGVVSSAEAAVAAASPSVLAPSAPNTVLLASGVAAAARVSTPLIRVTPFAAMVGETYTVTGQLPKAKSRLVRIQRKSGTRWVTESLRSKTTGTGRYTFKMRVFQAGSYTLRVWAPRARVAKKMRASYVTPARRIRAIPVAQAAYLSMPTTLAPGTIATATLTFRPIRAGRQVQLQVLENGVWVWVAKGTQSATGTASLPIQAADFAPGTYQFRAITAPVAGLPEVVSLTSILTVTP